MGNKIKNKKSKSRNRFSKNFLINLFEPKNADKIAKMVIKGWCLEAESNHRHKDFQSFALPTELSRHNIIDNK